MHFSQGLFLKYVAFFWFLHRFTGHACKITRRLLLLLLYFNAAVFSVKSKRSYSPQRMLPFSRMFTSCWINKKTWKHLATAPSVVKIISFKYFRESLAWVSGVSGEKGKDGSEKGREVKERNAWHRCFYRSLPPPHSMIRYHPIKITSGHWVVSFTCQKARLK